MDKYVKVAEVIDWFFPANPLNENIRFDDLVVDLHFKIPKYDVVPVVHSSWGKTGLTRHKTVCAHCGEERPYKKIKNGYFLVWDSPFCPHCGAKMEEELPK